MIEGALEKKLRKEQGLLTLSEVAARLDISRTGVYHRINAGELKSVHFGSRHLVSERDLEDYIARLGGQRHEGAEERGHAET